MQSAADDDAGGAAEGVLHHPSECEYCGKEIREVQRTAASVLGHRFDRGDVDEHLTDLDLALFATYGLEAPNAEEAIEHLSVCRQCRDQFVHVRRLLDQHEDLIYAEAPPPRMPDRSFGDQVRLIISDTARIWQAVIGFLSWILEWAMLLIVIFQITGGYFVAQGEIGRSAATEFLGIVPRNQPRLWMIASVCLILAIFFRWLGAQLYHSAVEQDHR